MNCKHCNVEMLPGQALRNVATPGSPDLGGDIVTMSEGTETKMVACLKCPQCGHSVIPGTDDATAEARESLIAELTQGLSDHTRDYLADYFVGYTVEVFQAIRQDPKTMNMLRRAAEYEHNRARSLKGAKDMTLREMIRALEPAIEAIPNGQEFDRIRWGATQAIKALDALQAGAQTVPVGEPITSTQDFAISFSIEVDKAERSPTGLAWLTSIIEARDSQVRAAALSQTGDSMDFSPVIEANKGKEEFVQPEGPLEMKPVTEEVRKLVGKAGPLGEGQQQLLSEVQDFVEKTLFRLPDGLRQDVAREWAPLWDKCHAAISPSQSEEVGDVFAYEEIRCPSCSGSGKCTGVYDDPLNPDEWACCSCKGIGKLYYRVSSQPEELSPQIVKDALNGGGE